jgi:hypothetical protein
MPTSFALERGALGLGLLVPREGVVRDEPEAEQEADEQVGHARDAAQNTIRSKGAVESIENEVTTPRISLMPQTNIVTPIHPW